MKPTKEEILNMPAGREMDALVAEKIFRWENRLIVYRWIDRKTKKYPRIAFTENPDRSWGDYSAVIDEKGNKYYCGKPKNIFYPQWFSETISAAWEVRNKIQTWPWSKRLQFKNNLRNIISSRLIKTYPADLIGWEEIILFVEPMDICNAALLTELDL